MLIKKGEIILHRFYSCHAFEVLTHLTIKVFRMSLDKKTYKKQNFRDIRLSVPSAFEN